MSRPLPPRTLLLILLIAMVVFGILYYAASSVNKAFGAMRTSPSAGSTLTTGA